MEIFTEEDAMAAELNEAKKAEIERRVGRVIELGALAAYHMLEDGDSNTRAIGAIALGRMGATEATLEDEAARAGSEGTEAKIVEAVEGGIRKAAGMVRSENPAERAIGTIALGRIRDRRGIGVLENAMASEKDGSIATLMAATLEKLKSEAVVVVLPKPKGPEAGPKAKAKAPDKGRNKA